MDGQAWLDEVRSLYRQYKRKCERAAEQISNDDFFAQLGRTPSSIAVLMKHLGGNNRSRWRDFLITDGEKQDRRREGEFTADGETRATIQEQWEEGWCIALETLDSLEATDLERTITIRGEPMTVVRAILRNLNHAVYHTGQIIQLARHFAGDDWQMQSIPPGKSDEFNAKMSDKYGDWWSTCRGEDLPSRRLAKPKTSGRSPPGLDLANDCRNGRLTV